MASERRPRLGQSAHRAIKARALRSQLEPGERVVPFYAWDFAACACAPSGAFDGVPCISAAVIGNLDARTRHAPPWARCLRCGKRWPVPDRRRADRMRPGGVR